MIEHCLFSFWILLISGLFASVILSHCTVKSWSGFILSFLTTVNGLYTYIHFSALSMQYISTSVQYMRYCVSFFYYPCPKRSYSLTMDLRVLAALTDIKHSAKCIALSMRYLIELVFKTCFWAAHINDLVSSSFHLLFIHIMLITSPIILLLVLLISIYRLLKKNPRKHLQC